MVHIEKYRRQWKLCIFCKLSRYHTRTLPTDVGMAMFFDLCKCYIYIYLFQAHLWYWMNATYLFLAHFYTRAGWKDNIPAHAYLYCCIWKDNIAVYFCIFLCHQCTYIFLFLAHFYAGGEKIAYLHVQDGVTIEKGPVNGDGRRPPVNNTVQILYKYHTNILQKRYTNTVQLSYKYCAQTIQILYNNYTNTS